MSARFHGQSRQRRGSILILVLWASLGLVSVALLFGHSMVMNYRGADNDVSGRQADQAIEGAARYVETLLVNAVTPGQLPDLTTYETEAVPVGDAKFWFLGRPADAGNGQARTYGLLDEASRLNINKATVAMLIELPGMTDEFAAAIVDWRDTDEDITTNGAEAEAYSSRQPPYTCKNADFESIEELALVNGATREILYGEDANMNGVLDPNEDDGNKSEPPDNSDGKLDPGILEYVTVFSRESTMRSDGTTARVNISDVEGLRTMLTEVLGQDRGTAIMTSLGGSTLTSPLDLYITSGASGGNDPMTQEEYDQIAVNLTMTGGIYPSPINVNTASEKVLACIPGLRDQAQALVAARLTRTQPSTGLAWVVEALGADVAKAAGPFITGQSWQVTADVAAVGNYGRGYRRTRFVVDATTSTPQIIYRRNLAPLGWTLGTEIREDLALRKGTR